MQRVFLLMTVAMLACRERLPPSQPAHPGARDSATRGVATRDLAALRSAAAEATAVCEAVADFWRQQPVTVRLVDSVIRPPQADTSLRACVVLMSDEHGLARLRASSATDNPGLARALVGSGRTGWVQLIRFAADGPAAEGSAFQRGAVRCAVLQTWAVADDDPGDWLEEVTECWPALDGIAVADTVP